MDVINVIKEESACLCFVSHLNEGHWLLEKESKKRSQVNKEI